VGDRPRPTAAPARAAATGRGAVRLARPWRGSVALHAGALAGWLSRRLHRGSGAVIGGRIALAVDPGLLRRLSAGRRTVLVTGTNGKTTTAHLTAAALRTTGEVAHNDTGANMADGITAALARRRRAPFAVLEVDELHLRQVAAATSPSVLVLLNLTRDQLDRSGEVAAVAADLRAALAEHATTLLVANADDPLVTAVAVGHPRVSWFAGGASWSEDARLCPRCGHELVRGATDWRCPSCALCRPRPDWELTDGSARGPTGAVPLSLRLPGQHNRANALAALAAAAALGVPPPRAADAMRTISSVAHRYATVDLGAHRLTLLLAKNPAGWQETLALLGPSAPLVIAVNAQEADGRDTSWLWDVPFERLPSGITVASGDAAADVGLRLSYAAVRHSTIPDPLAAVASVPPGDVVVVANYTAFRQLLGRLDRLAERRTRDANPVRFRRRSRRADRRTAAAAPAARAARRRPHRPGSPGA
jgi:UDP-N-acetylmuramyl tripeptide synthase